MKTLQQAVAIALFFFVFSAEAALTPTDRVKDSVDSIIKVLKDDGLNKQQRWDKIGTLINRGFDFQAMSQSVLSTQWRKASPEEKRQFVGFFSQYLEDTYRTKIEAYDDQEIRYVGEKVTGDRAIVDTLIVAGETEIPVSYRLCQSGQT